MNQTTQILLMRHPETVGNMELRYVGQSNSPLSQKGEEQKEMALRALCAWKPELIVSSPLKRCLVVGQEVAQYLSVPLNIDKRAIEIDFGKLEGMKYDEVLEAGLVLPWDDQAHMYQETIGFESMDQLSERVSFLCEDLRKLSGKIAVITHGGVIRSALNTYFSLSQQAHIMIENVSSHIIEMHEEKCYLRVSGLRPHELYERAQHERVD